jgi:hypothetical protein
MTTEVNVSSQTKEVLDIKSALESLNNPLTHNQALIDSRNLLNLSLPTLLQHFQQWLWLDEGVEYKDKPDEAYAIQLGHIEEALVLKGLISNL